MRYRIALVASLLSLCGALHLADCDGCRAAHGAQPETGSASLRLVKRVFPWPKGARFDKPTPQVPDIVRIAESPAGAIALGDWEGNVFVWDRKRERVHVASGRPPNRPVTALRENGLYRVEAMRFRGGNLLYWVRRGGKAWQAELKNGEVTSRKRINRTRVIGHSTAIAGDSFIRSVEYGHGSLLAKLWRPWVYVLKKYSLKTGVFEESCEIYPRKGGQYHWVNAMAVSPDEKLLAIASENNCGIVSIEPFKLVRAFGIEWVKSLAFSPDGSRVALTTGPRELLVYDMKTQRFIFRDHMPPGGYRIQPTCFSSENVLWFYYWYHLRRLDVATGSVEKVLKARSIEALRLSNDRKFLYVGHGNGLFEIHSIGSDKPH